LIEHYTNRSKASFTNFVTREKQNKANSLSAVEKKYASNYKLCNKLLAKQLANK